MLVRHLVNAEFRALPAQHVRAEDVACPENGRHYTILKCYMLLGCYKNRMLQNCSHFNGPTPPVPVKGLRWIKS